MTEDEKSALDIIYSLPALLKKLESKIDVIDNNVKILNNKVLKLSSGQGQNIADRSSSVQEQAQKSLTLNQEQQGKDPEKKLLMPRAESPDELPKVYRKDGQLEKKETAEPQIKKIVLGNIKLFGYIKTTSMKPVTNATIRIFDKDNDLIKNISTDKDGYWECRLPAGQYNSEILISGIKPINRQFTLLNGMKEFELK
jgi:hypothetical protein